ncbi:MAG TPA: hypothetical protein PKG54_17980, partial [Phycisphaerae bacterium]|nr:hypothetical protein [Phycisphaerae bacterium]HOJ56441.1 hypothetical protein [Phycisphaerae bacterium]HQE44416.1 hypothetical protein [Phycisphaerae bacterium]
MQLLNQHELGTLTVFERRLYDALLNLISPVSERLEPANSGFWWRVNEWVADDSLAHMVEMRVTYLAESALSF